MSRNDANFTHHSQNIPTAPLNHRAATPFIQKVSSRVTPPPKRRRREWLIALLILMMLIVIGAGLGAFFGDGSVELTPTMAAQQSGRQQWPFLRILSGRTVRPGA